jgi:hypothetical protein
MPRGPLFFGLVLALGLALGSVQSLARIDDDECSQVRALVEQQPHALFFQTDQGFFPLTEANSEKLLGYLEPIREV